MKKFLHGTYAIEVKNGRLNMGGDESKTGSTNNGTYVKKIRNGNKVYPYVSGQSLGYNMKQISKTFGANISNIILDKESKNQECIIEANPYKNYDEDLFGFMRAKSIEITEGEYEVLPDNVKKFFNKDGKKYKRNITKKRLRRLMKSPLQTISSTRITEEFCTRKTDSGESNILYSKEVYSNIMNGSFSLDIDNIGVFTTTHDNLGYIDYLEDEIEALNIKPDESGLIKLDKNERFNRIKYTLKSIQYLNTNVGQNTNQENINSKFIIIADYSLPSNLFINCFRDGEFNIEYFKESLESYEEYRLSDIYIGIYSGFMGDLKEKLQEEFKDNEMIHITTVKDAFDSYLEYTEGNLK
ncbi:MAG: DevR family CRISPR-associated autoregulator [Bacilli bacterium]